MAACRFCGKEISFLETEKGKLIPVEPTWLIPGDKFFDRHRHRAHFADCTRYYKKTDGNNKNKPS